MKKYISLEHTIKQVVAEQNYKKPVAEAISPVDYDKPKEVPQAFFKPVHIQPRKGEAQIPAGGPVRSRRNVEKEKSSETMHPDIKEEEQIDEYAGIIIKGATKIPKVAPQLADDAVSLLKNLFKSPAAPKNLPTISPTAPGVPAPAPAPTVPAPAAPAPAPAPVIAGPRTGTQQVPSTTPRSSPNSRLQKNTRTGNRRRLPDVDIPAGAGLTPATLPNNLKLGHKNPVFKHKAKARIHHEEAEIDRKLISNVGRPNEKRDEIVGRPDSPRSKYTKQAEIVRKIIEDKKLIIKSNKEKNLGKNPLVDTEPKLKRVELDQGSEK
jgi:hypothetical protein